MDVVALPNALGSTALLVDADIAFFFLCSPPSSLRPPAIWPFGRKGMLMLLRCRFPFTPLGQLHFERHDHSPVHRSLVSSARKSAVWLKLAVFGNGLEHRISNFATLREEICSDGENSPQTIDGLCLRAFLDSFQRSVLSVGQDRIPRCSRSLLSCSHFPGLEPP